MKSLSSLVLIPVMFLAGCGGNTPVSGPPVGAQTQTANDANGPQTQKYDIYEAKGEFRVDSEMLQKFFRHIHDQCWKEPAIRGHFVFGQYPMRGGISAENRQGVFYPVVQVYNVNISFHENTANPESYVTYNPVLIVVYAMEPDKMENEPRSSDAVGFALNGFRFFYLKYAAEEYVRLANEAESKKKVNEAGAQEKTGKAAKYRKAAEKWRTEEDKYRKLAAECVSKAESFLDEFADGLIYVEYELRMYDNTYPKAYYVLEDVIEQNYGPKIKRLEEKRNTIQWKKQKIAPETYGLMRTYYGLKNEGVPFTLEHDGAATNLFFRWWAEPDTMEREKYSQKAIAEPSKKWNYVFLGALVRDGHRLEAGEGFHVEYQDAATCATSVYCGRLVEGGYWDEPYAPAFGGRMVLVKPPLLYPIKADGMILLARRDGSARAIFIKDATRPGFVEIRELPPEETAYVLQVPESQIEILSGEVFSENWDKVFAVNGPKQQ